jgi:hypothetical protein
MKCVYTLFCIFPNCIGENGKIVTQFEKKCIQSITPRYQKKNYGKKTASHDSDDADFK